MKVKMLRLQNIKSYLDECVRFFDGVNFISGINGAGKSTIIESIGFVLFDYKPGTTSEFLRYGAKTGTITLEFEANDARDYRIIRKFGSVNSWTVYDIESNSEIDLHGASDIKPWLKEVLNIDSDQDLAQLFNDIVGVSQGTFTAPFLETPANRKQKFNKILKVEAYNEAYHNSRNVISAVKEKITEQDKQLAILQERVSDFEEVRTAFNDLLPQIEALNKGLMEKQTQLDMKITQRNEGRALRTEIEHTKKAVAINKLELTNLQGLLEKLELELQKQSSAALKVASSTRGYQAYLAAKKQVEELEKKRLERDKLTKDMHELANKIAALQAETAAEERANDVQSKEISHTHSQKLTEREARLQELKQAEDKIKELELLKASLNECPQIIKNAEKELSELNNTKHRLYDGLEKWKALKADIAEILNKLTEEPILRAAVEELSLLEKQITDKRIELAGAQQSLNSLKENILQTQGGLCPFLNSPCQNVGGDLDKYFQEKSTEIRDLLMRGQKQLQELEGEADKRKLAVQALQNLEAQAVTLQRMQREESKYIKGFEKYFHETLSEKFSQLYTRLAKVHLQHLRKISSFAETTPIQELISVGSHKSTGFEGSYKQYTKLLSATAGAYNVEWVSELLEILEDITEKQQQLMDNAYNIQEGLTLRIDAEAFKRSASLTAISTQKQLLERQLEELNAKLNELNKLQTAVKIKTEQITTMCKSQGQMQQKLAALGNIDGELDSKQLEVKANLEDYETYIKFLAEAERLSNTEKQLQLDRKNIAAKEVSLQALNEKLLALEKCFNEEALVQSELEVEALQIEIATQRQLLQEKNRDFEVFKSKLKTMEKINKDIVNTKAKIDKYLKIREILEFIRSIYNKAGERVASVYREYLGQEANRLYREVSKENLTLEWRKDYEVVLVDNLKGNKRERSFKQLSGGEQMTAALAVRLALLGQLSGVKIGFFDEPTTNLDGERRSNLVQIIPAITEGFEQLFVISHDDSFDAMTDNVIQLRKDEGEGSRII